MKYLKSKKQNVIATTLVSIVCFALLHTSGALDTAGMAAIILNWLPLIIGLATIIMYLMANAITKKNAWMVTLLGNLLNLVVVIRSFWT